MGAGTTVVAVSYHLLGITLLCTTFWMVTQYEENEDSIFYVDERWVKFEPQRINNRRNVGYIFQGMSRSYQATMWLLLAVILLIFILGTV